jgi:hypothetical protein
MTAPSDKMDVAGSTDALATLADTAAAWVLTMRYATGWPAP